MVKIRNGSRPPIRKAPSFLFLAPPWHKRTLHSLQIGTRLCFRNVLYKLHIVCAILTSLPPRCVIRSLKGETRCRTICGEAMPEHNVIAHASSPPPLIALQTNMSVGLTVRNETIMASSSNQRLCYANTENKKTKFPLHKS